MKTGMIKKGLLLGLIISNYTVFAQVWSEPVRIIDPNKGIDGNIGEYSQLLVVNGNPAIAYYDAARGDLVYVRATDASGTSWGTPITLDKGGNAGQHLSFQIVDGNPAISYYSLNALATGQSGLRYLRANDPSGTTWGTPIAVDTVGTGKYTSLQIVNGTPAISYYDQTILFVKYVRATNALGSAWGTPITLDVAAGYTSLQMVNGNPAISYAALTGDLKYIRATDASGEDWGTPITLDAGITVQHTSLKVVNGHPAIAYTDEYNSDINPDGFLKYVRATDSSGTAWSTPVVLDDGFVGGYPCLQMVNGHPAVSYFFIVFPNNLKYIRATDSSGTAWSLPIVIAEESQDFQGGLYTSMQIVNGNPAISYWEPQNDNLKYVRATDASGTSWANPVTFDASGIEGQYTSLQIVNGHPAISYTHNALNVSCCYSQQKFVRATDELGTRWGDPVTIDTSGDRGLYNSLQIVNGNPAISYISFFVMKYIRATDVDGTYWGTPVTIDLKDGIGESTSLQMVNGNPAISYSDGYDRDLKFVRATDVSGGLWEIPPITLDSIGSVGAYSSLEIINGNPAVSYFDATKRELKFIRATDASGTAWGIPITVDISGGASTSLYIVNGNPAISYVDNNSNLKYVRATDASGATWGIPISFDPVFGSNTSLQIVNGNPAISYFSYPNGDLKYVRALDASGTAWDLPTTPVVSAGGEITLSMVSTVNGAAIAYYNSLQVLPYFIYSVNDLTPVTLNSVKAYQQGNDIAVEWKVQNETAIKHYEVEKSTDATTFTKVAAQIAAGNNQNTVNYRWLDVNSTTGDNFYRIRIIGIDGEIKYSPVVKVTIGKGKAGYQVYPNPVADNTINLQFINQPKGIYNLNLINQLGQVMLTKQISRGNGSSTETMELIRSIKKGYYVLEIKAPDKSKCLLKVVY